MALIVGTNSVSGPNGMTFALGDGGVPSVSVNGGPLQPIAGFGFGFDDETLAIAKALMPGLGFDRAVGTDFTPSWEAGVSASNAPTLDTAFGAGGTSAFTGGLMSFGAVAGTSTLALNPVTPGATTWNPILGYFAAKSTAWMMRGRFIINAQAFTSGKSIALLSLDATQVGGLDAAATPLTATRKIQLITDTTKDPRQLYIGLSGSLGVAGTQSAGPDCVLGGIQSRLPVNQLFTAFLGFDGTALFWGIGDDVLNPANRLNALAGQMEAMPSEVGAVTVSSNDNTIGVNFKCDALAFAYCASQENK